MTNHKKPSKRMEWTEEQLNHLRVWKSTFTNLEISRKIGCTKNQVIYALRKHKIKRTKCEIKKIFDRLGPILDWIMQQPKKKMRAVQEKPRGRLVPTSYGPILDQWHRELFGSDPMKWESD
jgi:hypothetical protein